MSFGDGDLHGRVRQLEGELEAARHIVEELLDGYVELASDTSELAQLTAEMLVELASLGSPCAEGYAERLEAAGATLRAMPEGPQLPWRLGPGT